MAERFLSHIHLKKGGLHGWEHTQSTEARHRHLEEAARRDGWGTVSKRLNVLATATKNRDPAVSEIAKRDEHWVERNEERHREHESMREY